MRTARLCLGVGIAVLLTTSPVAAQEGPSEAYRELVARYAAGQREEAVAALAKWSKPDLEAEMDSIAILAEAARSCAPCPAQRDFDALLLRAAVMLHTDRDLLDWTPQAAHEEITRACGLHVHDAMAERLVGLLAPRPDSRSFARRWFLAMILRRHWDLCFEDARHWARAGLHWFPADAEILLARGTAEEVATLRWRPVADGKSAGEEDRQRLLERARRSLQEAAAADAGSCEARVRLGRVLLQLGKREEARRWLEAAVARCTAQQPLYLSHLFLGRVHESAGRLPDAVAEYRRALESNPQSQVAGVALSYVLQLQGDAGAAREVLERGLRLAPRRLSDAFWLYPGGRYPQLQGQLEALREEAGR